MKLEWMLLAEGLGQDSRGAVTAIGLNQNVLLTPTLPVQTKRAIVLHLVDDQSAIKSGDKLVLRVSFVSPSGKVINAITSQANLTPGPWLDLPFTIDVPAEMMLLCSEYGTYEINAEVELSAEETIGSQVALYVREPISPPV
jgi:hypothetical protein